MEISTFITVTSIWLMIVCSLSCAAFMALLYGDEHGRRERSLQRAAMLFFLFYCGIMVARLLYKWFPAAFVYASPLLYACHTLAGPALYYIVRRMTAGANPTPFRRFHLVLPLVVPVVIAVWLPFVPFDVPLGIVKGFRAINPDWPVFSNVFASFIPAEILFVSAYLTLSLVRLHRFRRSLPASKRSTAGYQLRWLYSMAACICIAWIFPVASLFTSIESLYGAYLFLIPTAAGVIASMITLLYNLHRHNYPPVEIRMKALRTKRAVVIPVPDADDEDTKAPPSGRIILASLSRRDFDRWLRRDKPYLNPRMQLIETAEYLGLSRAELSNFVNRTYGVNFSVFINRWRLRELDALAKQKKNRDVPLKRLLRKAGFGSYNSFMRARQQQEDYKNEEDE